MLKTITANAFIGGRLIRATPQEPVTIEVDDIDPGILLIAPSTPIGNATPEQLVAYLRARSKLSASQLIDLIAGPSISEGTVELEPGKPRAEPEQGVTIVAGGDSARGLPLDNTAPSTDPNRIADALRTASPDLREAAGLPRDPPPPKDLPSADGAKPYDRMNKTELQAALGWTTEQAEATTKAKMIEAAEALPKA